MKQYNVHPLGFTTSAVFVAYLLINDLTIIEQSAIGAWFNVVGDILSASSAWSSVLEERCNSLKNNDNDEMELLKKSIEKIQKILDDNNIRNNKEYENE